MASLSKREQYRTEIWPGFVDALTTLLLVIMFLLTVFVLAQVSLGEALSSKDQALDQLRGQMSELADLLNLEKKNNDELRGQVTQLSGELQASINLRDELQSQLRGLNLRVATAEDELAKAKTDLGNAVSDRDKMAQDIEALAALRAELEAKVKDLLAQNSDKDEKLITEKNISDTARAQIALLNQQIKALRDQMAQLSAALDVSEKASEQQRVQIVNLGQRLNAALASKVEELTRFRSEFFGRLRDILGNQQGIRIVGDRFVFQSEVLFDVGSADLGDAGKQQIAQIAKTLADISKRIPKDIDWVLQVEGHTDRSPIATARFPSNWELSSARAISVVREMIADGLPPERLAATGYGEFKPIETGTDPESLRRNRRIELKLTQR